MNYHKTEGEPNAAHRRYEYSPRWVCALKDYFRKGADNRPLPGNLAIPKGLCLRRPPAGKKHLPEGCL